jgi:hypothetical protein
MTYNTEKYRVWKLPHPLLLHWVLNPGLAFNELFLGQRTPKVILIDKTSSAPLMERQYVPCPHCKALNDARLWAKGNAFGHWFGYVCRECGGRIPCLWNLTSLIILAATFPIWIWLKVFAEERWLERERRRIKRVAVRPLIGARQVSWARMGLMYGLLMFGLMAGPRIVQHRLSPGGIALQLVVWLGAGCIFGITMKLILGKRK